jgi:prepilin-type N-terminal cleavage/methylation domain-containing protein
MDRRGFTLSELLVSMSIMMVITTMAIVNFRNAEYADELLFAAENIAAEMRRAQNFALISRTVPYCAEAGELNGKFCFERINAECGNDGQCIEQAPQGGWGLVISTDPDEPDMIFYADTGNADRISGESDHQHQPYETYRRLDFTIGRNVLVKSVEPAVDGQLDICFEAPRPRAHLNGATDVSIARIVLEHRRTGNLATITLNGISGQVNVD